tara:strand:+ start:8094 stop:9122 length:1029 start_codon:yes stop_codon:yes gene_type:complete
MRLLLCSLSTIYGVITKIRNLLFDYKIIKSETYNIPIICIGNLSIGGSGKTPHTNYIAQLLTPKYKIAILSRGYRRKSSGFKYVKVNSDPSSVGDEPLQLKQNNEDCIVAVNKNRNNGIKRILNEHPETNIILLDDGFQHRKIKAGLNILITPFDKPFTADSLLPLGTLRESYDNSKRADIIIISKTPEETSLKEKRKIITDLNLQSHQREYFSSIYYHNYKCLEKNIEVTNKEEYSITLITGIANPNPLVKYLRKKGGKVNLIQFSDHHDYKLKDIKNILSVFNQDKSVKKLILTTEKDATKLRGFLKAFKGINVYYIPIDVIINDKEIFKQQLLNYVTRD